MERWPFMPMKPADGDHVSNHEPQSEVLDDRIFCGRRPMFVWTALLLGALGGTAVLVSSSTLREAHTTNVAGSRKGGSSGLGRPNEDGTGYTSSSSSRRAGGGAKRLESIHDHASAALPRVLTVLTTYGKRSALVKEYKEAVLHREDGYDPTIFVVSDVDDEDPHGVVDFKVGSSRHHRSIAAIAEATVRYAGMFDWIALGDDDTAFMYNRAMNFLSHIDHTKPVILGRVDGLNSTERAVGFSECFLPEEKRSPTTRRAAHGCCQDFANPCRVPVFPDDTDANRTDTLRDYGPDGLFWPYGGSGTFISAGLAVDVVGADGWGLCARMFIRMNTDVQVAQCLKMHGYSMGSHPEGFAQMRTSSPGRIQQHLAHKCEVLGVHLGIKHLVNDAQYTPETFGAAVAAVREADTLSARDEKGSDSHCHGSWASFPK